MSVKISWAPSREADVVSYDLERAVASDGAYALLVNILHDTAGVNYDSVNGVFFYDDTTGDATHWYRIIAIDSLGNRSIPSEPFQAAPAPLALPSKVKVDHNYGTVGALRYQTPSGVPIEGAIVRVYRKIDFDTGNTHSPLAVTVTNVHGNWTNPIYLATGFTYVVQYAKDGLYGPDKTEIVV